MSTEPHDPAAPQRQTPRLLQKEEPEFVNERDIPTEDAPRPQPRPDRRAPQQADIAGDESVAGEEDPGAALDTPRRSAA